MLARSFARQSVRSLSTTRVVLSSNEGATAAGKDAFSDRERAQETAYVKKHEAEQLKALKEQLAKQKETIDQLAQEIKSLKK
ncbi:hypothetical protein PSN45_000682 [Yamadazyma tenuis]|uniref:ATPase inhibitor, mitochondrial n=1 Tax=Candida tenuis (strain ATCC 10573 / BCRC 21748 / CBS 615 / JCM 9827 / NBRC 10315 / NRRL Y-1498 / VKM Y-70) TaxID=590646 RepID=G3B9U6_CANTC|nr:uncharacterized protein CANTEDRAFT_115426 [Yamadazyma tenuis ATCC 10573]XP_006688899.1 uncharacterized protein CANTEDRAFT_115426 [Yamadazyma tenuis ATCC 10573]EGV62728.1 hypothetical protein CANTEDRAFT_115426 [Yamadazyma tenuis ATCC 10573]EGV62729.1 hypothetical protein CANTEDRAFT_115426 [Yamadazyma tenuis ATCC 10573]WEJ93221.1 hypothetical protein PSN45_000682 [Yamadazyma tenuis]